MKNDMELSRRDLIKILGAGATSLYIGGCAFASKKVESLGAAAGARSSAGSADFLTAYGPIDRTLGDKAPLEFSGDNPSKAHPILWNKEDYIKKLGGQLPAPTEFVDVVIVGGGMS